MAALVEKDIAPSYFEGPEKVLEIDFKPKDDSLDRNLDRMCSPYEGYRGFRDVKREEWNELLKSAACTILDVRSNDYFDAYLLSESSLFVYPVKVILKTCGTTTLLRALPLLRELGDTIGLCVEWIGYSRKDFLFPHKQLFPHQSFPDEVGYLQKFYPKGEGYVLGPVTGDHWVCFTAEPALERELSESYDRNLDMMMFDIDPEVAKLFMETDRFTAEEVTKKAGIDKLMPGAIINDWLFDPCGYSLNALDGPTHFTIHITPEPECSFVSFATNKRLTEYTPLIKQVLETFKPGRFTATLFCDQGAMEKEVKEIPFSHDEGARLNVKGGSFIRTNTCTTSFFSDYTCSMANWTLESKRSMGWRSYRLLQFIDPVIGRSGLAREEED